MAQTMPQKGLDDPVGTINRLDVPLKTQFPCVGGLDTIPVPQIQESVEGHLNWRGQILESDGLKR
jgi:hypothetical protein